MSWVYPIIDIASTIANYPSKPGSETEARTMGQESPSHPRGAGSRNNCIAEDLGTGYVQDREEAAFKDGKDLGQDSRR